MERHVYLNAAFETERFLESKLLYTGDFLDDEFNSLYPKQTWLFDSVLRIGRDQGVFRDSLRISNETGHRLNYLLIESYGDKVMLFRVGAGTVMTVPFRYVGRLSAETESAEESRAHFGDAIVLVGEATSDVPRHFSIRVREGEIAIEAIGLELSHVTCCAVDRPDIFHE